MPNTHRLTGKKYWHFLTYTNPDAPKRSISWTTEFAEPFRHGIGTARKLPLSKKRAIVVGRWVSKEEQAKVIMANELETCESQLARTESELRNIIGDVYVEELGWN